MRTVVLVEDDPDLRLLLGLILREDPAIEVLGKDLGAEAALDLAVETQPDLLIVDQHLGGGVLGLNLAPEIKVHCPRSRVLLFTGFALRREGAASAAVDAVLRKDQLRDLLPMARELLQLPIAI